MNDSAQLGQHSDPSTYVHDLLKDAEETFGDQMYLDGASFDDVDTEELAEDITLNEMEEVE